MNTRKSLMLLLKLLLTAVVLYFLGKQIVLHWETATTYDWRLDFWPLLFSVLLALTALFVFSSCWKAIIASFGPNVTYSMSFRISYLSNLGRYIPGKVWQVFGILYLAKRAGVKAEEAAASFVLIQLFAIPASFLVFVLAAQFEPGILIDQIAIAGPGTSFLLIGLLLLICLFVVFYPEPVLSLSNFVLKKLGRPAAAFNLDKKVALLIFLGYFLGWICYGLAFWLFVVAVVGPRGPGPIAAVGLFNGAYQIGYLMLFAPGGLGPRELVMGALLTPFVASLAPALAIAARLWAILVETIAALVALAIRR